MNGLKTMKNYKTEKTTRIVRRLEELQHLENEALHQIAGVILEKVEFYDNCLKSWDTPHERCNNPTNINEGRIACNAGLDMADAIVNELRILYLQ